MFVRVKTAGIYSYLQIVENRREGNTVKQRVIANLGKVEDLRESGTIDRITESLSKLTTYQKAVTAINSMHARRTVMLGPSLVFDRLWQELGLPSILEKLLSGTKYRFSLERAIFLTVLHRLFDPGSDRAAERWKDDVKIDGAVDSIELHQLYRAMGWLGNRIIQLGSDPFTNRLTKDLIEEALFSRNRDLFSNLSIVFFDTTSIYFEGEGGHEVGRYGHSKDHRPDLKQMIVGAVLDGSGRPICCELWPGNVTDVKTLIPVVEQLKTRFGIASVCVIADRGMISKNTTERLEGSDLGMEYILGVRMRTTKHFKDDLFVVDDCFEVVTGPRRAAKDPSPLSVRERVIDGVRYIVCYNEDQAKKDKADRETILESLRDTLKNGDKSLVGNKGFRKYLKTPEGEHFEIDEARIIADTRFDGIWVLTTNTRLSAREVALQYKQLWMVESVFRSVKSILQTRPIYHKCDETIRGHVFCSFLALVLLKEIESRLEARGDYFEWAEIRRDLCALQEIDVELEGERWYLRTDLRGTAGEVLKAVGVAVPPNMRRG